VFSSYNVYENLHVICLAVENTTMLNHEIYLDINHVNHIENDSTADNG